MTVYWGGASRSHWFSRREGVVLWTKDTQIDAFPGLLTSVRKSVRADVGLQAKSETWFEWVWRNPARALSCPPSLFLACPLLREGEKRCGGRAQLDTERPVGAPTDTAKDTKQRQQN